MVIKFKTTDTNQPGKQKLIIKMKGTGCYPFIGKREAMRSAEVRRILGITPVELKELRTTEVLLYYSVAGMILLQT